MEFCGRHERDSSAQDGTAKLIVVAVSNGLLRKTARLERDVRVVTRPPVISVDSDQHYLYLAWLI